MTCPEVYRASSKHEWHASAAESLLGPAAARFRSRPPAPICKAGWPGCPTEPPHVALNIIELKELCYLHRPTYFVVGLLCTCTAKKRYVHLVFDCFGLSLLGLLLHFTQQTNKRNSYLVVLFACISDPLACFPTHADEPFRLLVMLVSLFFGQGTKRCQSMDRNGSSGLQNNCEPK